MVYLIHGVHAQIQTGGQVVRTPHLENHKGLLESLEILVWNPLEKQKDPWGPIASREKSVRFFCEIC